MVVCPVRKYAIGVVVIVFFVGYGDHRYLPVLTHSFPPLRSSDLFVVRWHWRLGDVAVFDNRQTQHYATADYLPHRRVMHRATILGDKPRRSEEHTSELQSLMRISYAVFCLKKHNLLTYTVRLYQLPSSLSTLLTLQPISLT